jgi:hypothetical protein
MLNSSIEKMAGTSKIVLAGYIILATCSLCWCIYRDVQIEKQYPGDLRNRIVGSRLQMDGRSPYFYHWKSVPPDFRYYDPENYTIQKVSSVTATPFFHQLLYPIANLPQRTISRVWLVLEYLVLFIMTVLAIVMAKEQKQKWAVLFSSLFFLHSYAWTANVEVGQMYIIIPFVAMLFYFFMTRPHTLINAGLAGIFAMSLVLIRPTAIVFFLPFLLLTKQYSRKYRLIFVTGSLLVFVFAFGSSNARGYWSDYREAMTEHVKLHQDISPTVKNDEFVPVYEQWEGWDREQIKKDEAHFSYAHNGEHGNFFVFVRVLLHIKLKIWQLSVLCIGALAFLFLLFYRKFRRQPFTIYFIALIGFCLYMTTDFFSPIHRHQYNASQWIFPLLLVASGYTPSFKKIYITGIIAGLLLNAIPVVIMPMQRTVGELLIYASLVGLLLTYKTNRLA